MEYHVHQTNRCLTHRPRVRTPHIPKHFSSYNSQTAAQGSKNHSDDVTEHFAVYIFYLYRQMWKLFKRAAVLRKTKEFAPWFGWY